MRRIIRVLSDLWETEASYIVDKARICPLVVGAGSALVISDPLACWYSEAIYMGAADADSVASPCPRWIEADTPLSDIRRNC